MNNLGNVNPRKRQHQESPVRLEPAPSPEELEQDGPEDDEWELEVRRLGDLDALKAAAEGLIDFVERLQCGAGSNGKVARFRVVYAAGRAMLVRELADQFLERLSEDVRRSVVWHYSAFPAARFGTQDHAGEGGAGR
jgi:hypothetical protein